MSNNSLEQYQEIIDKYFERSLSTQQEQDFLISLASNQGLQNLFRAEIILREAVVEENAEEILSERVTNSVMAGFSSAPIGPLPGRSITMTKRLAPLLLTLLSFGIGFGVNGWLHTSDERIVMTPNEKNTGGVSEVIPKKNISKQPTASAEHKKKISSIRSNIPAQDMKESQSPSPKESSLDGEQPSRAVKENSLQDKPFEVQLRKWEETKKDSVVLPK